MDKFPDINWSAVAREAIKQKIILLKKFREFTESSTLNEEEALRLGREVNKALAKKYTRERS
ncbi:hypothetical protein HY990_02930 [Candidatus Micrarchaeota archaeon]|nr:hypothetical protein [Candidatus Micrarchaeota archaeon]